MNMQFNGASGEQIRFHYDAGRDFYALWLDTDLTFEQGRFALIRCTFATYPGDPV